MGKFAPNPVPPQGPTQRAHSGRSYWVRNIPAPVGAAEPAAPHPADALPINHEPANLASPGAGPTRSNPGPNPAKGVAKPSTKKRFVEPYRLSEGQREAMLAPLAELGLGDAESRDLFAAALAYDIATCYELTTAEAPASEPPPEVVEPVAVVASGPIGGKGRKVAPTPAPVAAPVATPAAQPVVAPALAELAQAARALNERLQALDPEARSGLFQTLREADRFQRGYDDAYLSALAGELLRLAEGASPQAPTAIPAPLPEAAAETLAAPTPVLPPRKVPIPKPSPAARQFIVRAADAFEECFDQAPTAKVGGPFAAMLKALAVATGIRIPTDARNLAEILRHA